MKAKFLILLIVLCISQVTLSQIMNTSIQAILEIQQTDQQVKVTAMAQNKTDLTTSIMYKLSFISQDAHHNISKNEQSQRLVIGPYDKIALTDAIHLTNDQNRIIVLLLIYDSNDQLIGNSRFVINDHKDQQTVKQELVEVLEKSTSEPVKPYTATYENTSLKGIVVDQTKTKAGKDFYQLYYCAYLFKNIHSTDIITITETITMGTNTKITIRVQQQPIYEFFVQPKYDVLKTISEQALRTTLAYFEQQKQTENRTKTY